MHCAKEARTTVSFGPTGLLPPCAIPGIPSVVSNNPVPRIHMPLGQLAWRSKITTHQMGEGKFEVKSSGDWLQGSLLPIIWAEKRPIVNGAGHLRWFCEESKSSYPSWKVLELILTPMLLVITLRVTRTSYCAHPRSGSIWSKAPHVG